MYCVVDVMIKTKENKIDDFNTKANLEQVFSYTKAD